MYKLIYIANIPSLIRQFISTLCLSIIVLCHSLVFAFDDSSQLLFQVVLNQANQEDNSGPQPPDNTSQPLDNTCIDLVVNHDNFCGKIKSRVIDYKHYLVFDIYVPTNISLSKDHSCEYDTKKTDVVISTNYTLEDDNENTLHSVDRNHYTKINLGKAKTKLIPVKFEVETNGLLFKGNFNYSYKTTTDNSDIKVIEPDNQLNISFKDIEEKPCPTN